MRVRNKQLLLYVICLSVFFVVGLSFLTASLNINGTTTIQGNTWNVKFLNLVTDSSNTVTGTASITNDTTVDYSVTLNKPGDKYSFTVDVKNTGSIDAMINSITKSSIPSAQQDLIEYYVTYSDYVSINQKDKLVNSNGSETIRVSLYYKLVLETSDLPSSAVNLNLSFSLNYVQADSTANIVDHTATLDSFIVKAKTGHAISSDVGKTFTVNLTTYGNHTLRVANVSAPTECFTSGFSHSACGVVLEFEDIITTHEMNEDDTNVGGWPAISMRTFINEDIYNAIPSNLKSAIIETSVVSGHGSTSGETNFVTTDKLYLLSAHEVWTDGALYDSVNYDTSHDNTRQLDYYAGQGVTTSSYSGAIKKSGSTASRWWLRSATFIGIGYFLCVSSTGGLDGDGAASSYGVSPAFRIA